MIHTKEPWVSVEGIIYPSNGLESGEDWIADLRSAGNSKANERRIVACVNACVGYSTDELETHPSTIITKLLNERDKAERQRDELLEALKSILPAYREAVKLIDPNTDDAITVRAHNAIAKVESGNA